MAKAVSGSNGAEGGQWLPHVTVADGIVESDTQIIRAAGKNRRIPDMAHRQLTGHVV
ncbi:MAG: hypothetical protein GY798_29615 [Hyphomicrobiales bacterium]|nr:hypothetical protein [Hyphomicrobiales bacterium]